MPAELAARTAAGERDRDRDGDSLTGMILFLGSWAMLFGALFFAYGKLRARAPVWPPPGAPPLPVELATAGAVALLLGSAALARAGTWLRRGAAGIAQVALVLSALLGAAFVALQLASYRQVSAAGLHLADGAYAAVFYGLTALHAAHVAVGLPALIWLALKLARARGAGPATLRRWQRQRRAWALYFHFLAVVFAVMLLLLYRL